jgi:DNA uptake protein ComE-like DNA-binding protein
MILRKIKQFVKTYFYFNHTERRGVIALLAVIILVIISTEAYRLYLLKWAPSVHIEIQDDIWNKHITQSKAEASQQHPYAPTSKNDLELPSNFSFNPNTADEKTWQLLGVSSKQYRSIQKYLNAGGTFKTPNDIGKIYTLDRFQVARIIPYASIPTASAAINTTDSTSNADEKPKNKLIYPIDINIADSATLVRLYGIGPIMASKIVNYRDRLGGFFNVNQLVEISGFDEDRLYDLKGKITADTLHVRKIRINQITFDELSQHPYTKYKLSRVIVNYRNQHGAFKQAEDLSKIVIMHDTTLNKLKPYLDFE